VDGLANSARSSRPRASPVRRLAAGVLAVDLLAAAGVAAVLHHTREERHAIARVDGANLAHLLETGLAASLERVDLALQAVADEHLRMARAGGPDGRALEAFLARERERTPELLTLRVTDAAGFTRYNAPPLGEPVSLADRDYFAVLRDDPSAGLIVTKPTMGRIIQTPVMIMARKVTDGAGGFAGVVFGSIALDRLDRILSGLDVGRHGILTLRFRDLSLVARAGAHARELRFGDTAVSPELGALLAAGRGEGSYDARSPLDGERRTFSFRRFERYPLLVVVGLARRDYLAVWGRQVALASLLLGGFVLVTLGATWATARSWRHRLDFERLLVERTEHLRESEERFRIAFETSPDSINLNRVADGVYVAVNEGFTRMTGWTEADVVGRSSVTLGIWADPADRARLVEALEREGFIENLEAQFRRKDGSVLVGLMSARRIDLQGEALLLSITRDVSAWKAAEEERDRLRVQFQQAQRLESIGRLAGGVAHDFNNLLTVILASGEALRDQLGEAGTPCDDVEQIATAAGRARDLTRQLLAFARRQVIAPVPLDLGEVVRRSEKLLRRVLGEDIALAVELEEGLWPVLCDPAQLEQVILNLVVNARDAMPEGGTLAIAARNAEEAFPVAPPPDGRPGQWVRLSVRDSGGGMTAEVKAHLFEPFFTTKAAGKGTGLGLATVDGIVAQSGGHIEVESAPGRGTAFHVYLPRATDAPAEAPPRTAAAARARSGEETILVVEDDPLVRNVTLRALRGAGYRVLVAASGNEAVSLVEGHTGRLDLVVSDVVMPGLSGPQAVEALRRLRPGLRALYLSGHPQDAIADRGVLELGVEFLPKPFTAAGLLDRVRALLEG
jgi:PAS domain S-box-containing protein